MVSGPADLGYGGGIRIDCGLQTQEFTAAI